MITRFGLVSRSGDWNDQFVREYTRVYQIECDSVLDAEPEIYAHPDCPVLWQPASFDQLAVCTGLTPVFRKNSRWTWDMTAKFSTQYDPAPESDNPLTKPAEVVAVSDVVTEDSYVDLDGRLSVNAAGSLLLTKVRKLRTVFKIKKNVAAVNAWLGKVASVVNSAPVRLKGLIYPRGTLLLDGVELGADDVRNRIAFMPVTMNIRHRDEGWETTLLNVGLEELTDHPFLTDPKTQKPVKVRKRCLDGPNGDTGDPVTEPVFLDTDGVRPRVTLTDSNGVEFSVLKQPLELSDIVTIQRRFVTYFDFNKLPIR